MDVRICITGTLTALFFSWSGRAGVDAARGRTTHTSNEVFPKSVEVIPGKLKVKTFLHEIKYENETIPC